MAIKITTNSILQPSPSSTYAVVPLTIFDRANLHFHVPILFAFPSPTPSNSSLKEGLSKALAQFPHFAGRISTLDDRRHRPCFIINNAGIRLIETVVSTTTLSEKTLLEVTGLTELYPPVNDGVHELLQVQLNRYPCGGLVIGLTFHHRVADGQSMSQFLVAWSEAVRSSTTVAGDPSPLLDRASFFVPRNPPTCKFNHREIEFRLNSSQYTKPHSISSSIENLAVHFSAEFIAELKARVPNKCTTFKCLLAHLWKKITVARGIKDDELTQVRIAVNGRGRMRPAVPKEFFGNLVLWAHPMSRAAELVTESHQRTVMVIDEAVARLDDDYFRSFIDFGEVLERDGGEEELVATSPESGNVMCPNLEVDSWLGFHFHEVDFGSGGPCMIVPPDIPIEGLMVFVPSCMEKGGVASSWLFVRITLTLSKEYAILWNEHGINILL